MLFPSQLTLQVALEDPSSLSKLKKRVTKTKKLFQKLWCGILGNLDDSIKDISVNPIVNNTKKAKDAKVNPDLIL